MQRLRKSEQRGSADHGWLKSKHTFSFAGYSDPNFMGFRSLRVINEDRIAGGTGFGAHPHHDMEIISYVVSGALQHEDSIGTKALIQPGEVQRMSAGTGVTHSEKNASSKGETHFFQIWIIPKRRGIPPSYGQKSFADQLAKEKLVLVISNDGRQGSIKIEQDADMYISRLKHGDTLKFDLRPGRGAWIQVVHGELKVNSNQVVAGDALSFEDEPTLMFEAGKDSEFMLFDLAQL